MLTKTKTEHGLPLPALQKLDRRNEEKNETRISYKTGSIGMGTRVYC